MEDQAITPGLLVELEAFCDEWTIDDDGVVVHEGECGDGDPSWRIEPNHDVFAVHFEMGWYLQDGEAEDEASVIRLMNAMVAADKALDASLREQGQ